MTLKQFFQANPEAAVAFSGGADSAYLLYAAARYARRVRAYCARSPFQPAFEWEDARRLAGELGVGLRAVELDVLALPEVAAAAVSHESGTAVVTLSGEISDAALKKAVEDQDYQVTGIQ